VPCASVITPLPLSAVGVTLVVTITSLHDLGIDKFGSSFGRRKLKLVFDLESGGKSI